MEIPYTVTARPDTGLWNAKVGIWLFLASEVMLFGGLFSSYVFLRLGADYPWPMEELQVGFGFVNTLILIASSVFVVYAWVALKMRQWRRYQFWMSLVIACAAIFLVNKGFEYKSKFSHYHATLNDGSIIAGHLYGETSAEKKANKSIVFDASHVIVDSAAGSHHFLNWLENREDITFSAPAGQKVEPSRRWFAELKYARGLIDKADGLDAEGKSDKAARIRESVERKYPDLALFGDGNELKLALSQTGHFVVPRSKAFSWADSEMSFSRKFATKLEGNLVSAHLKVKVDELDMREYLRRDEPKEKLVEEATIFGYFEKDDEGAQLLADFTEHREAALAKHEEEVAKWKAKHPDQEYEEANFHEFERVKLDDLHAENDHAHEGEEKAAAGGGSDDHGHPVAVIPFEDIEFFSNYGPRKNTFYAIYFTMTGLHGLHVFGGMLVLGYFLFRGRKLYLKNPEHMANRVEVGGLFWHFVDLVWIFLFPIFYLM